MFSERNKFHIVLRSHGKRSTIHFLPEEILFDILILLSAETLYNMVRYVCRQWYAIIQDPIFISAHFLLSTTTLLRRTRDGYQLLDVKDSCANTTHFKFVLRGDRGRVFSTCNGLVLMGSKVRRTYYVGNPITRKLLALPKLSSSMKPCWSSLAVSACSRLYKVVLPCFAERFSSDSRCAILTLGDDEAWRVLDFTYLNLRGNIFLSYDRVEISRFVYWISVYEKGVIYALDVDSETVKRIAVPYHDKGEKFLLPKGNSISLLICYPDCSMEIWVLKDTRSEECVKFGHIEGEPMRNEWVNILSDYKISYTPKKFVDFVRPIFWLGNGEKILFDVKSLHCCLSFKCKFFVYDLKTHACSEFDKNCHDCELFPFMNSLAWV